MKDEILRFLFLFFYFLKAHQRHLHNFPKNMATTSKFKGLKKPIVYWFQTLVAGQTFAFRLLQLATYDHLPQRKIVGDLGNYPSMVKLSFRLREGIKSEVKRGGRQFLLGDTLTTVLLPYQKELEGICVCLDIFV